MPRLGGWRRPVTPDTKCQAMQYLGTCLRSPREICDFVGPSSWLTVSVLPLYFALQYSQWDLDSSPAVQDFTWTEPLVGVSRCSGLLIRACT